MPANRKPSWMRLICAPGNPAHLKPRKCDGCGQWTITCENGVWESYDPGIITGTDTLVAVILGLPLTRMDWDPLLRHAVLIDERTSERLDPTAAYLAPHRCGHAPVSLRPFRPPRRNAPRNTWTSDHEPTPEEISEFDRIWRMPLTELKETSR